MSMFSRRRRAQLPLLNTAATADMAFMLLIFFLVTTSMDPDKGLARQLPPADSPKQELPEDVAADKVLRIELTAEGSVVSDGETIAQGAAIGDGRLRQMVTAFIDRVGDGHLICLSSSRDAAYEHYFTLINEITAAYNALGGRYEQRVAEEYN